MYSAFDPMCLQSEIYISSITRACVVLVQYIIQALIEVLQVKKDDCSACLHTDFDSIDVPTNLQVYHNISCIKSYHSYYYTCMAYLYLITVTKYVLRTCVYSLSLGKLLPKRMNGLEMTSSSPSFSLCSVDSSPTLR